MCGRSVWSVAAAVAKACDVADEDLAGVESVSAAAASRRVGDPVPGGGLHELAYHVGSNSHRTGEPF
jgi:hypothetical protein